MSGSSLPHQVPVRVPWGARLIGPSGLADRDASLDVRCRFRDSEKQYLRECVQVAADLLVRYRRQPFISRWRALGGPTGMRRGLLFSAVSIVGAITITSAVSADPALPITTAKAPIVADGTTAGADTDFVVTFADVDPDVPGIDIKAGGTISLALADGFVRDNPASPMTLIVLQGWPQSPRLPFPDVSYDATTNTLTGTLPVDYLHQSVANPGPKQLHAMLPGFANPGPGSYPVELTIQPDPSDPATMTGTGTVKIIPKARPSINAISVINGAPPPPFPNSIYQTINTGDTALPWGFYVWDKNSEPFIGVDLQRKNRDHYTMIDDKGRTVGQVRIQAPAGAADYSIDATASVPANGAVLGIPTGLLKAQFNHDPDVPGDYAIGWRLNNGNEQSMYLTVNPD
jgi:hypothetical protein